MDQGKSMGAKATFSFFLFPFYLATCAAEEPPPPRAVAIPAPKPLTRIMDKDVRGWIEHLQKHENEQERKLAMFCLTDFGPAAAAAVPELLVLCKDELQPETQRWAAEALGAIGPAAKEAVPELLSVLNNQAKPQAHRAAACAALAQIDPEAAQARKAILGACRDPKPEVRAAAIDAAVTLAPFDASAVAVLSRALYEEPNASAAASALRCLGREGEEVLARAVERGEATARAAAAEALSRMGSQAASVVPIILKAARRERDAQARAKLILAAARIAPTDATVLEALVERLASGLAPPPLAGAGRGAGETPALHCEAESRLLAAAGPKAVAALRAGLHSHDATARRLSVSILARLPHPGTDVVDDIAARLQDRDQDVRLAAVKALDGFGPAAAKARPILEELARIDPALRRAAELAVLNVTRDLQTPRYHSGLEAKPSAEAVAALKDPDPALRQEAAEALRTRTDDAGPVAGALIDALQDGKTEVRVAAAISLAHFGKYARVAMGTFTEWLEATAKAAKPRAPLDELTTDEQKALAVPKAALAALAGMGPDAVPALPVLIRAALSPLPENDTELKDLLGAVLRVIGPDAASGLIAHLKSPDAVTRARAASALASMGQVAAIAVPDLIELSKSMIDSDAQAGFAGLQAIGPAAYDAAAAYLVDVMRGDTFADRRKWAAWALGGIRVPGEGDPKKVIDGLLLALLDPDDGVCRGAHAALVRIGAPALPRLRDMLKLGVGEAPYWAVRVLARMKADPADVIPPLAELTLPDRRPVERGTAAELLGEYAPGHPEIIPVLLRLLGDREEYVARIATRSLTLFGASVIEPLEKLLQQRNPLVRRRALEALESVRAAAETKVIE